MIVFAIDPGPVQSGWVLYDGNRVRDLGVDENYVLRCELFPVFRKKADMLGIEMIASYGMAVGAEVFETCVWIGRFMEQWPETLPLYRIPRADVKLHLCKSAKAKDSNIRQAILDIFPPSGGGVTPQVGTKSKPGPLFGMNSHTWPALGVAMVTLEKAKNETTSPAHKRPASRRIPLD